MCWSAPIASSAACASPPGGATSYTYDKNGNQTTSNTYDALSRQTATGSTGLGYLTPGNQELTTVGTTGLQNGLLGLMRQVPSTGSATAYTRQPNGTPIAQRTTTAKQYLLSTSQLGSITAIADNAASSLTRTITYDPDGTPTTSGTGATSDLGYAAGYTLPGGLIHHGARYYNPNTARWTQRDPLNQNASLQQANRYTYAGSDPIDGRDPAGLAGSTGGCSLGPATVSGSRDDGASSSGASFGVGLGFEAGCGGSRYRGTTGKGVSADGEACLVVCVGVNSDSGFRLGLGVKAGFSFGLSLDI